MTEQRPGAWRATFATATVLAAALAGVASVWSLAAWWSFAEQTRGADHLGFAHPAVLPWTLDGLAFSLALVALAAALDGRPAPLARLGVLVALTGSVWANRLGVQLRSPGGHATDDAVRMAAVAPLSAFVAFEVILAAIRRLVMRWRGLPAPTPIPTLRPVRVLLAPLHSVREWRAAVLAVTTPLTADGRAATAPAGPDSAGPVTPPDWASGDHVDAAAGSSSTPPSADSLPAAVDGGRVDAPAGVRPPTPGPSAERGADAEPDGPPDTAPDVRADGGFGVRPDADRTHRTAPRRTRGGRPAKVRPGRPAGHSPDRTFPDWRTSDWSAVAQDRGISRTRAYEVIAADPAAPQAARQRLAAASAPLNGHAP